MADDIRRILHDAAPAPQRPADFDAMWDDARRRRRRSQAGAAAGLMLLAGAALLVAQVLPSTRTLEVASVPDACPVTIPDGDFVPPPPYPTRPPTDGEVWYGSPDLWTVLYADGDYRQRKSIWWSENFQGGHREEEPQITVTWEALDDQDPSVVTVDEGTNAHTYDHGWFMIADMDPAEPGCWRVTASYRGAELSYVYFVDPS